MDNNELATFNQAVKYAQSGYNEKAFEFMRMLAQKDPDNIDLIFWGMYTAPNLEWADSLFERAKRVAPGHAALPQAEQWLINEKLRLPHPSIGYSLFPPNINTVQIGTSTGRYQTAPDSLWQAPTQSPYAASMQALVQAPYPAPIIQAQVPTQVMPPYQPPPYYPPPGLPPVYFQVAPVYAVTCRYCRTTLPPRTGRRTSTGGWITFGILVAIFFPLCWVGLFFKEDYRVCSQCGIKLD